MNDLRTLVREQMSRAGSPGYSLHDLDRRRERKLRNQRITAGVIGVAVFALFLAAVSVVASTAGTQEPGIDGPSVSPTPASPGPAGHELAGIPNLMRGYPQPTQHGLEEGRYWLGVGQMRVSLAVPRGWDVWVLGGGIIDPRNGGQWPSGTGIGFYQVEDVYADPCRWERGMMPSIGPSAADLAAALARQPDRAATTPTDVELGGFNGKMLRLHVPSDVDFSECSAPEFRSEGEFRSWPGRFHQGAGQVDEVWILDVEGERLVIDAWWFARTSADEREKVIDIVESIRIHPAPAS
jgi:hypothetical protein